MNVDDASMGFAHSIISGGVVFPAEERAVLPDEVARAVSTAATIGAKIEFGQIVKFRNTNPALAPALEEAAV